MGRLVLLAAGLYAAGIAAYWWLDDPCLTRDRTYERVCGHPLAVPKYTAEP